MSATKRVRSMRPGEYVDLTSREASNVARAFAVCRPRVGYEVCLAEGLWLASSGHAQFGWFDKPGGIKPFCVRKR